MNLDNLINNNSIDKYEFDSTISKMILLSIFEEIYAILEKDNNKEKFKSNLRKNNSEYLIKELINSHFDINLESDDYDILIKLVSAYLRKSSIRKRYSKEEKLNYLKIQHRKCAICNCEIDENSSHLDHIVPFKMVGDELENNLQLLCGECNLSKSGSINFYLKTFVKRFLIKN